MKCDRIYIDYEDYPVLEDEYTKTEMSNEVSSKLSSYNADYISSDATLVGKVKALTLAFVSPIYDEYHSDRLGYLDSDVFLDRVINSLMRKINKWYAQKKIQEDLIDNATLEKFISNGGTKSNTKENGTNGSAVIQKSASTPTSISHNSQSETIDVELTRDDENDTSSMEVTDGYADNYTNFVGKTNGLHRNEVERDTDIARSSNYGLALEILDKIPYSYISEVLSEVSQHFIQIY